MRKDKEISKSKNPKHRQVQTACSDAKKIRIVKFCINGEDDAGPNGEHMIRLNGDPYYPTQESDCYQDPIGFCEWRESQCHNLENARFVTIDAYRSIDVGTEEHDSFSENESFFVTLLSHEWYNPTCNPYEVMFTRDFESEMSRSVCWNIGGNVGGSIGGIEGELNAGIEDCSEWIEPSESYVWLMIVEPNEIY